jgi:hypothetical protein
MELLRRRFERLFSRRLVIVVCLLVSRDFAWRGRPLRSGMRRRVVKRSERVSVGSRDVLLLDKLMKWRTRRIRKGIENVTSFTTPSPSQDGVQKSWRDMLDMHHHCVKYHKAHLIAETNLATSIRSLPRRQTPFQFHRGYDIRP